LAVEQVDMDGDGSLETSLWPVSDLLGSIELVTDGSGSIVERITYDPEGRPQFWSADTQRPRVTRVAWTGDGRDGRCPVGIPAVACPPGAFQLGFGEELDAASASAATATLTPEGGSPQALALSLTPDARAAYLTGAALQAGIRYTLHLEGLRDRAGNLLWQWGAHTGAPLLTFTLTDPTVFQVLEDTAPPRLLAALDAADGLYLAWEEPVEVASGFNLDTSIAVLRQGQLVQGTVSQLSPQLFRWKPVEESQWLPGGEYTLSAVHRQDLSGKAATAPSLSFTHMAGANELAYLIYQAPGDSQPQARSAYGVTTLFQGRTWHEELGLYHYRARWYLPEAGVFAERDPEGYRQSPSLYQFLGHSTVNAVDPTGAKIVALWYGKGSEYGMGEGFDELARMLIEAAKNEGVSYRLTIVHSSGQQEVYTQSAPFIDTKDDYEIFALSSRSVDDRPVMRTMVNLLIPEMESVILVGHSLGAVRQVKLADELAEWGVPVALMVAVDMKNDFLLPTPKTIPGNVQRFLAFFSEPTTEQLLSTGSIEPRGRRDFRVKSTTQLLGIFGVQEVHTRMDSHPTVLNKIVEEIRSVK
jgi:RHS repeat-associated protein